MVNVPVTLPLELPVRANEPPAEFILAKSGHALLVVYVRLVMLSSEPLPWLKLAENWYAKKVHPIRLSAYERSETR